MSHRARFFLQYFVAGPPIVWLITYAVAYAYHWLLGTPSPSAPAFWAGWGGVLVVFVVAVLQAKMLIKIARNKRAE